MRRGVTRALPSGRACAARLLTAHRRRPADMRTGRREGGVLDVRGSRDMIPNVVDDSRKMVDSGVKMVELRRMARQCYKSFRQNGGVFRRNSLPGNDLELWSVDTIFKTNAQKELRPNSTVAPTAECRQDSIESDLTSPRHFFIARQGQTKSNNPPAATPASVSPGGSLECRFRDRSPSMSEPYKIVVGLEVHVQLLTRTKLFCGCLNKFGLPPNSATCPVCLGLPGALPVMNEQAFRLALKAALALNCTIANHHGQKRGFTKWDRKNYYYPDLPKNFQISQYDLPFSHDGWLEINVAQANPDRKVGGGFSKKIGIIRAHLEEDAGKNLHDESGRGGDTRVDLNRTGTPLLEIVSRPDMNSPEEAVAYLEEIRLLLREIAVSDCEMQEGSLRCDANVNIHVPQPDGTHHATPLVEIKNLNSFRGVGRAIAYEGKRHYEEYRKDPENFRFGKLLKTTAGWDDARGVTVVQRHKEEAADYRYFPEPDLVPVVVSQELIDAVRAETGELPGAQRTRLQSQYGLSANDAQVLTAKGRLMVAYFEEVAKGVGDGKAAANRVSDLIYPALSERKLEIGDFPIPAAQFADFMKETSPLSKQDRVELLKFMLDNAADLRQAMEKTGIKPQTFDEATLRAKVIAAMSANPKSVADFKSGKLAAANKIKGEVMKTSKGAPNDLVQRLLEEELARAPG
jgi:aspartyl-tRNA(Asn)/glutamyl-tRNA(Gln) amidotransferase subunit B